MKTYFRALIIVIIIFGSHAIAAEIQDKVHIFTDACIHAEIQLKDIPTIDRSRGMNRAYLRVEVKNVSSSAIKSVNGLLTFNWLLGSLNYEDKEDGAKVVDENANLLPVPLTAWGNMMSHATIHRRSEIELPAGTTKLFDLDIGRMYDLSLRRRYFIEGTLPYTVDGKEAVLTIKRFELTE